MELKTGDEIGRGGFCMVHKVIAHDDDGDAISATMAIKRLRDDLHEPPEVMKEIRDRFEREARLLDDTLDHENIVPVIMRNLSGDHPFFVMPLADGNLADLLAEKAGDEEWVCRVFRQVLEGMAYAHGKGVIHRDLKPENALRYGEQVRLSDLGLGKNLIGGTVGLTKTAVWSGTEAYMSPEQFSAMKETGPATDVFALGKLLMILLTGDHPDVGAPDVSELPERFRYFVSRCCEKKPENRFTDARAALEAFEAATTEPEFKKHEVELEKLEEAWFATPEGPDLNVVKEIDRLLREHPDDEALFTKQVPRLPGDLAYQYLSELPDAFAEMLATYDSHVSGGLPFEYCDTVANFYGNVFHRTDRLDVRKIVISRLLEMGYSHHRYHVRTVLLGLLSGLDEAKESSTIAMVVDIIKGTRASEFPASIAMNFDLPVAIKAAFKAAA
ncbi:MAG: serine/threonine protein kinase [Thermoleophilia bacterium]